MLSPRLRPQIGVTPPSSRNACCRHDINVILVALPPRKHGSVVRAEDPQGSFGVTSTACNVGSLGLVQAELCSFTRSSNGSIQHTSAQVRLFRQIWAVYAAYYSWGKTSLLISAFNADECFHPRQL
jgi:hypothetical protein